MNEVVSTVLIANRGEVVSRIARTLRKMGRKSIAVYVESDAGAPWINSADKAVMMINTDYLDKEGMIEIAKGAGADSIHPGFGFLSENADFARQVRRSGLHFIGPGEDSIHEMGNKLRAKSLAIAAGVSVIPGLDKPVAKVSHALQAARKIGYPVIIKAAAGGGGKGIRLVNSDVEFGDAFELSVSEAHASFGDGSVFIEKYIENPRHIEIQIVADKYGNVVCLGERECSIQRRYQKIIEETPSVMLHPKTRDEMFRQCVSLAKSIGYYSVGTVEFVANNKQEFFFLEMNTRLQVEHTVTEMVAGIIPAAELLNKEIAGEKPQSMTPSSTGVVGMSEARANGQMIAENNRSIDLVQLMVEIEEGYPLNFTQSDIIFEGSAIETRIYAEDPESDFSPSIDRISTYIEPQDMTGLRIETGIGPGSRINPNYDPMIVKLCAYGSTRDEAIANIRRGLSEFVISGRNLVTNMVFLEFIVRNTKFMKGDISTDFVKNECSIGKYSHPPLHERNVMLAALAYMYWLFELHANEGEWDLAVKFLDSHLSLKFHSKGQCRIGEWSLRFTANNIANSLVMLDTTDGALAVKVCLPTQPVDSMMYYASFGGFYIRCRIFQALAGEMFKLMPVPRSLYDDPRSVVAQMTGKVVKIFVSAKQSVKKGDRLLCIEAMKMQNIVYAKANATVEDIHVNIGDLVDKGIVLMNLLPENNQ